MSRTAASEAPLSDDELGESPILLALGREIPGFGGIYYEPGETRLPHEPDSVDGDWKQPYSDRYGGPSESKEGLVGKELWDLEPERCERGARCRHADAAVMKVDEDSAGIAFGKIARTVEAQEYCEPNVVGGCRLLINPRNPTLTIIFERPWPLVSRSIHKVGRTTGWTYGTVHETCADKQDRYGVWILCSHGLKLFARGGDSGAPVFMLDEFVSDSTEVHLVGIVWGGDLFDTITYVSNIDQIRKEFKDSASFLTYFHRDSLPPKITGIAGPWNPPMSNPPSDSMAYFICTWVAETESEGMQPPTYEWSGVLSGTGKTLVARTPSEKKRGQLYVKLTDAAGQIAEDSLGVTISEMEDHPDCIKYDDTGV